ncbi:hypothetical protein ACFE04_021424 [Oxalis oulophora]
MARRRFVPITSSNDVEGSSGDAPHGGNGTNRTIQGQAGDSSALKRARRHTRMNEFRKLKRGEKAPIPLNEFGAPVGDLGGSYCNFLCTIAQHSTYCPLVYEQWHDVPVHMKNKIWDDEVLEDENVEDAKLWLKERGVCFDQYRSLVRFWQSEKGKKVSERGKTNRSNGKVSHAARSKEFVGAKKRNGKMPGCALMYYVTHTNKDKNYVNLEASQIADSLQNVIREEEEEEEEEEKLEQDDQDGDEESDTQAGTDPARPWMNDGYSKVMGADRGSKVSLMGHLTLSKEIDELKAERAHQSSAATQ